MQLGTFTPQITTQMPDAWLSLQLERLRFISFLFKKKNRSCGIRNAVSGIVMDLDGDRWSHTRAEQSLMDA